ncbi:gliding motility protein GldL [Mucilaginibacter robiniae]|uniref:Gliding motility protein GldL n=1 Tax=Mucilaginibacter robiniae TaxID=2728022 RepID=A0A7L5E1Z6_9SPHI|nr:gliding motility protein GldL [Mucilaginibacter robiniae]QJD95634.1 gliding motility protein GldL [Mucilaginibacter robiniae]
MANKKQAPAWVGSVINFGATVVIIGLLFKIQHWPYASTFITVGLGTEAFLFALLGFFSSDGGPEQPTITANTATAPVLQSTGHTAALDKMLADAKINPELIGSLGEGLRTFGDKVSSISKVADAGAATTEFATKLKAAGTSYDNLSGAFAKASANLNELASSGTDAKAYHEQVTSLAKNLSALNAVYELELQDSSAHLKSMNKFYQNLSATMSNFNESLDDSNNFKDEVGRLAKNLGALNSIYGNMLTAMNQPRV